MKLFYIPHGLRCPTCRSAPWIEGEPSPQGKLTLRCIARHCAMRDVRLEVQLPSVGRKTDRSIAGE